MSSFNPATAAVDPERSRANRVSWCIVALLMGFSFMSWFNRSCMAVAADDQIMPQFGISEQSMGAVYSAFFLTYTICMTPGGWMADRFGPRFSLALMGLGSALFVVCTGLVGFLFQSGGMLLIALLVARSLMGAFTAPIYPSSARLVASWLPVTRRAGTNGLVQGSAGLGIASSFLVFGWLVSQFGWQYAFVITGIVTAGLAIIWGWYARNRPEEHPAIIRVPAEQTASATAQSAIVANSPGPTAEPGQGQHWTALLRNRNLILITLSYAAVGYFEYLFIFWTHYYFKEVIHLSSTQSKLYAGIPQAAFAVGMIGGGWLSDRLIASLGYRWGRATVPLIGMTSSAILLMAGVMAEQPVWIVTWISLANAAVGMCEGPIWTTAAELGGRQGGTAAGICNTGGNAGGMIAPTATPWLGMLLEPALGKEIAWRVAIGVAGVVCLLGVSLWFWIDADRPTE